MHEIRVDGVILGADEVRLVACACQNAVDSAAFSEQEAAWLGLLGLRLVDDVPRPTILTDAEGRTRPDDGMRAWTSAPASLPDSDTVTVACTDHNPPCVLTVPRDHLHPGSDGVELTRDV